MRFPSTTSWKGAAPPQELQGVGVEGVQVAASVHQYLGEPGVADDRVDDERVLPGIWDIVGWSSRSKVITSRDQLRY